MSGKELLNNAGISNVITVLTVVVSITAAYFGLKGDIKDTRSDMNAYHIEARNELVMAVTHIKIYIDSNFRIRDHRLDILEIKKPVTKIIYYTQQKDINGNINWKPIK